MLLCLGPRPKTNPSADSCRAVVPRWHCLPAFTILLSLCVVVIASETQWAWSLAIRWQGWFSSMSSATFTCSNTGRHAPLWSCSHQITSQWLIEKWVIKIPLSSFDRYRVNSIMYNNDIIATIYHKSWHLYVPCMTIWTPIFTNLWKLKAALAWASKN